MNIKLFSLNQENIVAACYENGGIYFWNLKTNTLMIESKLHNEPSFFFLFLTKVIYIYIVLCFDLESSHLLGVSGSASNNICVFSINYEKVNFFFFILIYLKVFYYYSKRIFNKSWWYF